MTPPDLHVPQASQPVGVVILFVVGRQVVPRFDTWLFFVYKRMKIKLPIWVLSMPASCAGRHGARVGAFRCRYGR